MIKTMSLQSWRKFTLATFIMCQMLFSSAFAQTGPIFTYHGRLVDSTTNVAVNGTVNFLIQIQSTNNCLMYEEVQTKSLSQGVFAININSGVGTTTYSQTESGFSFQQIMSNTNTLNFNYATYSPGPITPAHPAPPVGSCTFTPSPSRTDARKLVVYFFNPSDVTMVTWEPLPVQTIGYVPMAVEALNVGGFTSASLLRFVDGSGNPYATTPLSNANYTELMALLTGTSTTFLKATDPAVGFTGALTGDVTGTQGATVVSRLNGTAIVPTAPVTGQYLVFNGTSWAPTNGSGGTVTNVSSSNAYVTITNPNTTPSITLNVGSAANTVAAGDDPRIVGAIQTGSVAAGDLSGFLPNPTVATVGGRTAAEINTSVTDTLAATNNNFASTIVKRDASGNIAVTTASATNFSGRNYLFYNSGNTFATTITSPTSLAANLNIVLPGTAGTPGYVLATDGAGNTSWVNPTTGSVTNVSAVAPIISSGGQTPQISIPAATDTVAGYLTATDHDTFNNFRLNKVMNAGTVWVGTGTNATERFLNISDIKSSAVGNPNWFNVPGACTAGQTLTFSAVTDTLDCQAYAITSAQVTSALGGTPISNALPANQILVGDGGGVAAPVTLVGDAAISGGNTLTIQPNAITTGKINNLAVTDAKIAGVEWTKIANHPTTVSGYGITDVVLTNAGGITDMQAGTLATRPLATATPFRYYISTDTSETWFSDGATWIKIGSAIGLGGTVTNVSSLSGPVLTVANGSTAPQITITQADTTTSGYVTSTDWNIFNNKLGTTTAFSGDISGNYNSLTLATTGVTAGTYSKVTVDAKGRVTVGAQIAASDVTTALGFTPTSAALNAGNIFVGSAGNIAVGVPLSGDAGITSAGVLTLANSGVTAGTGYTKVDVDAKGRVTNAGALAAADVTSALTYTPVNKAGDTMGGALAMGGNNITGTGNIEMAANKTLLVSNFVTDPTGPFTAADVGRVWYNTTTNQLKYYNGSGIQIVASAAGAVTVVTASAPLVSSGGLTPNITLPAAATAQDGYLTSTDWNTFNSKQPAGNYLTALTGDVTATGPGSVAATIAANAITTTKINNLAVTDAKINDVAFTKITGKPTTLGGYGITDAVSSSLTSANIYVGNASNVATPVALSGDATMDNAGVVTLKNTGTAGTYGSASAIPTITTDAQGRVVTVVTNAYQDATGAAKGVVSVGTNLQVVAGVISLQNATTAQTGALTATDWNTFNNKQNALGFTPLNKAGDTMGGALDMGAFDITNSGNITLAANKTLGLGRLTAAEQTALVAILNNTTDKGRTWFNTTTDKSMYWNGTTAQAVMDVSMAVTNVTASAPLVSSGGLTPNLTIPAATTSADGYLTSVDWNIFNAKQPAGNYVTALTGDVVATGPGSGAATIQANAITTAKILDGAVTDAKITDVAFSKITGKPTTLIGYGITDAISSSLTSANIFVGNASNVATPVALSGDATINNAGALTLASTVTAGTVGSASAVPTLTYDAKGRITSVTSNAYQDGTASAKGILQVGTNLQVAAGVISLQDATTAQTGALTATDWNTFNNKQNALGFTPVNKAGDTMGGALNMGAFDITNSGNIIMAANKSFGMSQLTAAEQTTLVATLTPADKGRTWYNTFTDRMMYWDGTAPQILASASGSVTTVTASAPLASSGGLTPNITMTAATTSLDGYLTSADWNIFNAKQPAGNYVTALTGDVVAAGPGSSAATIQANAITTAKILDGAVTDAKINDVAFGKITGKPTTLIGYGITDAISSALTSANFFVGNASNVATPVMMSGDATMNNTGAVTLASTITAGTIGSATAIPTLTYDAKGRITSVASNAYADATGASKGIVQGGANVNITAGVISVPTADTVTTGVITATDWNTFNNKQNALGYTPVNKAGDTMGGALNMGAFDITNSGNIIMASNKSLGLGQLTAAEQTTLAGTLTAGDKGRTWFNTTTDKVMYWDGSAPQEMTNASLAVTNVTASAPLVSSGGLTPNLTIPAATTLVDGYLSAVDWNTFNAKQPAGNYVTALTGDVVASGPGSAAATIQANAITTAKILDGAVTDAKITDVAFSKITGKPTTLGGYGITDAISSSLTSANILVGNASNVATPVMMSGDATIDNAGALTLASTVIAGTVGSASAVPTLTYDAKGRITSVSSNAYQDATGGAKGVVSVGTNLQVAAGVISLQDATTAQTGALTATDWNTFNNKQNALGYTPVNKAGDTMGGALNMGAFDITNSGNIIMASNKSLGLGQLTAAEQTTLVGTLTAGDKGRTWFNTTTDKVMYWDGTTAQVVMDASIAVTNVTASAPLVSSGGLTPNLTIPAATTSVDGYLSSVDWNTFNAKQPAGNYLTALTGDVVAAGPGSAAATIQANAITTAKILDGAVTDAKITDVAFSKITGKPTTLVGYGITDAISSSLTSANILVGNALNVATPVMMSGDATIDNTGALTLASTVTAGTVGSASAVPTLTYDTKGRITSVTSNAYADATGASKGIVQGGANVNITAGVISVPTADTVTTGVITATDWNIFNNKQNALGFTPVNKAGDTMGGALNMGAFDITNSGNIIMASNKSLGLGQLTAAEQTTLVGTLAAGDKGRTWFNTTTDKVMYWDGSAPQEMTNASLAVTNVTASAPLVSSGGLTPNLTIPAATTSADGYLTSVDWNIFNNKQPAGNYLTALTGDVVAAGPGSAAATIQANAITTAKILDGAVTDAKITDVAFSKITGKPTTLGGYGITDAISSTLTSANILVGNASNVATPVALSGDATIDNAGALTLASTITAGTIGSASAIPSLTYDAKGRITSVTSNSYQDATGVSKGVVSVGTNLQVAAGVISLQDATTAQTGALTATDWNTFNNKQNALGFTPVNKAGDTMGGALDMGAFDITNSGNIIMASNKSLGLGQLTAAEQTTLAGTLTASDKGRTWFNTTTDKVMYWDGAAPQEMANSTSAVTNVTASAPLVSSGGLTPNLTIPAATTLVDGYLSSVDWNIFNAKQPAGNYLTALTGDVVAAGPGSGAATIQANAITTAKILDGAVTDAKITDVAFSKITGKPTTLVGYGITDAISSALTSANFFVGNASNVATPVMMSGDATIDNTGALTLASTITSGTIGSATAIPSLTYDAKGRITSVTSNAYADATGASKGIVQGGANVNITAGVISVPTADTVTTGVITATDWNIFNNKQNALGFTPVNKAGDTMGGALNMGAFDITNSGNIIMASNKSLGLGQLTAAEQTTLVGTLAAGDKGRTWFNTTTNKVIYWDGATAQVVMDASMAVTNVTASAPLVSSGGLTPNLTIPAATTSVDGYLSSVDWNIFNNKQPAGNYLTALTGDVVAAGPGSAAATIQANAITTTKILDGAVTDAKITDVAFSKITGKPTTLIGYGITDAISSSLTSANIFVGNASNVATPVSLSGDATIDNTGALTLASTIAAGTIGSASAIPSITYDAKGRITSVTSNVYQDGTASAKGILEVGTNLQVAAGVISLQDATTAQTGALTAADWNTFNNKQGGSTELTALAGLATTGFMKRTAANTYSTVTAIDLATADVTGILPVTQGGTGAATLTAGSLLVGNGSGVLAELAAGTAGNVIYATGATTFVSGTPSAAGLVDIASVQTVTGAKAFTGATTTYGGNIFLNSNSHELQFAGSSANYVGFKGPSTAVALSFAWELPATDGLPGQVLRTDGLNKLSWVDPSAGSVTNVSVASPITSTGGMTPTLGIQVATAAQDGYLASADFTTFNAKQPGSTELTALAGLATTGVVKRTGANTYVAAAIDLATADVTGTLTVDKGGTGAATLTSNGVLLGNGTSAITATAAGTANQVLRIPGAGGAPEFGAIDISTAAAVTGTLAIANGGTGATTAANNTFFMGPATGGPLAPSFRTIASADINTIGFVQDGNSFAGTATVGTNDAQSLVLETNNTPRVTIDTSGGSQFSGQAWSAVQTSTSATPLAWDANTGNTMRWTTAGTGLTANITNLKPGASYMLVIKGAGTDAVTITCNGGALPPLFVPANAARVGGTANSKTIYTILSDGENCLITWITGF